MAKAPANSPREAKSKAGSRKPKADKPLRILMIASEAQPFSKTGGLADVAAALPKALGKLGHDVTLITPRYRGVAAVAKEQAIVSARRIRIDGMAGISPARREPAE